ncbi:ATP-grasp domain-containing protein [Proteiniborus ethanoligenes]|uniref:ATP-grasp domain-containing protein n=1 Tax=Proteiniborus ethanoligenes TaxID=415015 RepID=A0A1H3K049_9FIRM|nr:ATP-grasp domain-containing protein [Proteiniborus ethanoligenes]SDY45229.1 ATP-grasp domain-containing protein [Proteiniborus ethanoligenes]
MKKRILVLPCGSETGLEINRALAYSKDFELVGASSQDSNHGRYVYKNYIKIKSYIDDVNFIEELNWLVNKYKIDFIFPAHDSVVLKLSECRNKIEATVICPSYETCRVCREKSRTYELFKNIVKTPIIYRNIHASIEFPVFLKPNVGQGSKGTYLAKSIEEIEFYRKLDNTLLILEYLPGREYTVDCFTDRFSKLVFFGGRERKRIYNGISVDTCPIEDSRFKEMAEKINNTLDMRGVWFFQVKENKDGEFVLLEIGPRVAGSMGLYRSLGVNLPLLSLYDRLEVNTKLIPNSFHIEMDRALSCKFNINYYYENIYVDLDDCLIQNGKVNPLIIGFLFQCINNGKKIFLLTKHSGDLLEHLKLFRIRELFDGIIQIEKSKEKLNYIKTSASIFIDDSFDERYKVNKELNIPTFDINAVEALLDWKV